MRKNFFKIEKGITLVALVITMIILLILAGISVSAINNMGIFKNAKQAKEASEKAVLEQNKALDEYENELNDYLYKYIDKTKSYVGCYADLTGDGTVDGIIYADLAVGNTGSGEWSNGNKAGDGKYQIFPKDSLKDYYISQKSYTTNEFGTAPVLVPVNEKKENQRFYVMSLNDFNEGQAYSWYINADGKMNDSGKTTSGDFGSGQNNTLEILKRWNDETLPYGTHSDTDIWGKIEKEVNSGWFIPSRAEWCAFAVELGITVENHTEKGIGKWYWSSSQYGNSSASLAHFEEGTINYHRTYDKRLIRLSTIF